MNVGEILGMSGMDGMKRRVHWKFDDVVLDLDEVVMVRGNTVMLADGKEYGVGENAADAIRCAMPVFPSARSQDTGDTGQGDPAVSTSDSLPSSKRAASVRARLERPSSSSTSFPGQGVPERSVAEQGEVTSGTSGTVKRNFERFGSAEEAEAAFLKQCRAAKRCANCRFFGPDVNCRFAWGYAAADVEAAKAAG